MYKMGLRVLMGWLLLLGTGQTLALPGGIDDDIPRVEEAIRVVAMEQVAQQAIEVSFELLPDVYLYRHRFGFKLSDMNGNVLSDFAELELPRGEPKIDEIFGDVEVFHDRVNILLPLSSVPLVPAQLEVGYQGCLEDVLCYPPRKETFPISFIPAAQAAPIAAADGDTDGFLSTLTSEDANNFSRWMGKHSLGMVVVLFFCGGLLLAFTPCVFPMIPILSGIIAGAGHPSAGRGFSLSLAYVLGVAIPYTLAGMLVALFGAGLNLQYMLQQPSAIITSVIVFILLALAMFGLYELQLPEFLRSRLHKASEHQQGGSLWGAGLMGAISGLVVSPCVTPILAGALIYVASTGDIATGALSLFFLAFGMGVPLIIMGTGSGHILPKAGPWMEDIKKFFGITMLVIAVWLLGRIMDPSLVMALYGFIAGGYGVYLGAFEPVPAHGSRMKRTVALMLALYGGLLIVGAAAGGKDPLQPLKPVPQATVAAAAVSASAGEVGVWQKLRGNDALTQALQQAQDAGQPVLVDFYADWCAACKVLEEETLTHASVLTALSHYRLLQVDITEINDENQKLMERYNILGLPCLVFFDANGAEVAGKRILGEMGPDKFLTHLGTF